MSKLTFYQKNCPAPLTPPKKTLHTPLKKQKHFYCISRHFKKNAEEQHIVSFFFKIPPPPPPFFFKTPPPPHCLYFLMEVVLTPPPPTSCININGTGNSSMGQEIVLWAGGTCESGRDSFSCTWHVLGKGQICKINKSNSRQRKLLLLLILH